MLTKLFLSAVIAASTAYAQTNASTASNLTAVLASNNLTALTTILAAYPEVAQSLANATNVTILAPSNAALAALNSSGAITPAAIQNLLSYHVLDGIVYSHSINTTRQFLHTTLNNATASNVTGGQVVEGRLVNTTAEIISGLKSVSNVTTANINFTGGVIHIIDKVLTIPSNITATGTAANLTAFLGAVNITGLTERLDTASDITIFAPSNTAFQDVASGLGNLSITALTSILGYHVVNGTIAYSSMLRNETVTSFGGARLTTTVENGTVFVNSARVVNADILISGGVLHIIDAVLNPNNTAATGNATETSTVPVAFSGASSESMVPFTSGVPTATTTIEALVTTTEQVVATQTVAGAASSTSKKSNAAPTGAVGAAALFGGAAFFANL